MHLTLKIAFTFKFLIKRAVTVNTMLEITDIISATTFSKAKEGMDILIRENSQRSDED